MEDYAYEKFLVCDYVRVRRALSANAISSESNGSIDKFFFDDSSSATIPAQEKHRSNMLTVRYRGRRYPLYVGKLERYLSKINLGGNISSRRY